MTFQLLTSMSQTHGLSKFYIYSHGDNLSHIDPHPLVIEKFNTLFSPKDRSTREKLSREILEVTDIISHVDLTNNYRVFYPNIREYYQILIKII